jgi:plastocyanin
LIITLLVAAGCGDDNKDSASSSSSSSSSTSISVPDGIQVGAGVNDPENPNIAVLQFMPAEVAVDVGTPVTWDWSGTEPHSVTFLAPGQTLPEPGSDPSLFAPSPASGPYDGSSLVSSGLVPLGPDAPPPFSLSFAKAGSYPYYCVIHPQMVGTVTVSEPGGTPDTPAEVAQRRATDQATYLTEGRAAAATLASTKPTGTKNADGSTTWTVQMGTSTAHTDVLAFAPSPARVKKGDTVRFLNDSAAPHTASFFGAGSAPITDPTDPRTDAPAPGPSPQALSPEGFYNTGLLPPNAPPGSGPPEAARSFSFTVGEAGEYGYICILHSPSGMTGTVSVT